MIVEGFLEMDTLLPTLRCSGEDCIGMPEQSKCRENVFCNAHENAVETGTFLSTGEKGLSTQCIHTLQKTAMHHNELPFSTGFSCAFLLFH